MSVKRPGSNTSNTIGRKSSMEKLISAIAEKITTKDNHFFP